MMNSVKMSRPLPTIFRKLISSNLQKTSTATRNISSCNDINKHTLTKQPPLAALTKTTTRNGILNLRWADGLDTEMASVFLRDCCQCSECYNASSKQRALDPLQSVPLDIQPQQVCHLSIIFFCSKTYNKLPCELIKG